MDEAITTFISVTGQSPDVALRYLEMADHNATQAIQLFFESPDLHSSIAEPATPSIPTSSRPPRLPTTVGHPGEEGVVVHIDSDEDEPMTPYGRDELQAAAVGRAADYDDDEAMARRMQEEFNAGGDASGGYDADGVRAPIARTTETLVGEHDEEYGSDAWLQLRARHQARAAAGRPGLFNQRPVPGIWDRDSQPDPERSRQGLAEATGGASESSSKAARLATLFRPPFELMSNLPWDAARDQGKEDKKWIMVNVQEPSIFHCQQLNRDLWSHEGIREVVKENFIFIQYTKGDPRANQYIQYYLPLADNGDSYPHIAIIDPRTGEQVKVWSGPPPPSPPDFLMQLIEFLDRYSLDATKKNPVARRKAEKSKSIDVDRLTEDEALDLALKNSLTNDGGPKESDPDDLTKSFGDAGKDKGKGKEVEQEEPVQEELESTNGHAIAATPFGQISSNNTHTEPAQGPNVTRIQFRHSQGRVIRRFDVNDPVRRIYEWLKAEPLEGKEGVPFDLKNMGKDLIESLDEKIGDADLKNGTVMVEFMEE